MALMKRRASSPKATSWDKVSAREAAETLRNRDVHSDQQLDRGKKLRKRSKTPGMVLAVGTGVLVALVVWLLFSMISAAALSVSSALDSGLGGGDDEPVVQEYYSEETTTANGGEVITCYQPRTESGDMDLDQPCYRDLEEVPVPDWYTEAEARSA